MISQNLNKQIRDTNGWHDMQPIPWDLSTFTLDLLTSISYHCCVRLTNSLSLKFVWLPTSPILLHVPCQVYNMLTSRQWRLKGLWHLCSFNCVICTTCVPNVNLLSTVISVSSLSSEGTCLLECVHWVQRIYCPVLTDLACPWIYIIKVLWHSCCCFVTLQV